ncbi:MAG: SpoIIE family protein phosphatase [Bacteroidales bacterium]|nr:SpoIIE family protein phosphatase [Bacteroidales bacterium]
MKSDKMKQEGDTEPTLAELKLRQELHLKESLKYASRIQQAMFPSHEVLSKLIPDHFIFYQPREVVSGDFYYIAKRNDYLFVAVGDCTGHGVPGAFMSILGITCLNEIIMHGTYLHAGSVLNQMREHVMEALCQTGQDSDQRDGIDIALCMIDLKKGILNFAGAFNPVYIVRNKIFFEIAGDMMPVGIGAEEELSFANHQYELDANDTLYLFSDGFVDQFGGNAGKKFKYTPFRKLLVEIAHMPVQQQEQRIRQTFNNWKGNHPQVDDVLVFGFRLNTST